MSNGYSYTGEGRHYGIPTRDLTQDEFEALAPDQQRIVRESPAYLEAVSPSGLTSMKRVDLERRAVDLGIEDPSQYGNKDQLIEAIQQAEAGSDAGSDGAGEDQ